MAYDFDKIVDRSNTNSMKWNVAEGELPMWVADMDFETAPAIMEAISKRAQHGCFGYTEIPDAWYQAYIDWWKIRHDFTMEKDWLMFCTGVIPAISSIVRKLTTPAEKVLVQTPVYNIFFNSILNNGRQVLESPLVFDGNAYHIDFEDLEKKLADPQTTLMILCNPHNPVGKIWSKEELAKIGELCRKHHVMVFSDEIHCDLCDPGQEYVPFASASDTCADISITAISASKAFNIAGLQTAAVFTPNERLRNKIVRGLNTDEIAEPNSFAIQAIIAAFCEGEEWLNELNAYIYRNKQIVREFISQNLPQIHVIDSQATYLLWIDCSAITGQTDELCEYLRKEAGLYLSAGSHYRGNGAAFVRMNTACPKSQIEEGLRRLEKGIRSFSA